MRASLFSRNRREPNAKRFIWNRQRIFCLLAVFLLFAMVWLTFNPAHATTPDHTQATVDTGCQGLSYTPDGDPYPLCPGPSPTLGGNCVWWAWDQWHQLGYNLPVNWGNAADWVVNAERFGLPIGTQPRAGALAVFPVADGVWAYSAAGHVAFVTSVGSDNQTFNVTYQNYGDPTPMYTGHDYNVSYINQSRFQNGQLRFIYFPKSIDVAQFAKLPGVTGNSASDVTNANSSLASPGTNGSLSASTIGLGLPPGAYDQELSADFGGNGFTDLLLYSRQSGRLDVLALSYPYAKYTPRVLHNDLLNDPETELREPYRVSLQDSQTPVNGWGPNLDIHLGDFTGSGHTEILLYDRVSGTIQILTLTSHLTINKHITLPGWGAGWELYTGQFDGKQTDLFLYKRFAIPTPLPPSSNPSGSGTSSGTTSGTPTGCTTPATTPTKTPTPTVTPTATTTATVTATATATAINATATTTGTSTNATATATNATATATSATVTATATATTTATATATATTATTTPTVTPTAIKTATPVSCETPTATPTKAPSPTVTPSPTPNATATVTSVHATATATSATATTTSTNATATTTSTTATTTSSATATSTTDQTSRSVGSGGPGYPAQLSGSVTTATLTGSGEPTDASGKSPAGWSTSGLTADIKLVSLNSDFTVGTTQDYSLWHNSWEIYISRFVNTDRDGIFLYDRLSGEGRMVEYSSNLTLEKFTFMHSLGSNWEVHTGDFSGQGQAQILLYDPTSGNAEMLALNQKLAVANQLTYTIWGTGQVLYVGHFGLPTLSVMLYNPQQSQSTFIAFDSLLNIAHRAQVQSWGPTSQILIGSFLDHALCQEQHTCDNGDDILILNRQTGLVQQYVFSFGNQFSLYDNRIQGFLRDGITSTSVFPVDSSLFSLLTSEDSTIHNEELY